MLPQEWILLETNRHIRIYQTADPPRYKDKKLPDEVFFRLSQKDAQFESHLKLYAAALSCPATPGEFKERFDQFVKDLLKGKDTGKVQIVLE